MEQTDEEAIQMEENMDVFKRAWLFLYAAAGENIGFEVRPVEGVETDGEQEEQSA